MSHPAVCHGSQPDQVRKTKPKNNKWPQPRSATSQVQTGSTGRNAESRSLQLMEQALTALKEGERILKTLDPGTKFAENMKEVVKQ